MTTTTTPTLELPATKPGDVSYSPMERKLFSFLAKGQPFPSTTLVDRYYKNRPDRAYHTRQTINGALKSLSTKLEFNKAPIALKSSELRGPNPKTWWLEKKKAG